MKEGIAESGPREWSEARRRAETYLRALHGEVGPSERQLVAQSLEAARAQSCEAAAHPVTLVMEALFALLPAGETPAPIAMAPPIRRVTMLPEKTEFPFHEGLRRLFRSQFLPLAGPR